MTTQLLSAWAQKKSPKSEGFFQPAEWQYHAAVWLAWPAHRDLWQEELDATIEEFVGLCEAIADVDEVSLEPKGERLHVLVFDDNAHKLASQRLSHLPVRFFQIPYGDIWLRDTAPIFLLNEKGQSGAVTFELNGWGGKYDLPFDDQVAKSIAKASGFASFHSSMVLEGGALDVDGEGTLLTTKQCLLEGKRNPQMSQEEMEAVLSDAFSIKKVLWLNNGLLNDHTDGHVDTIARFVAPGHVVCMQADSKDDPNKDVLEEISRDLESFTDAKGRKLQVTRIPSPGKILGQDGRVMPASYVNFYIGNSTVVVPTYGVPNDEAAVLAISQLFPTRKTVGRSAISILNGGGAFHCITQQQPGVL